MDSHPELSIVVPDFPEANYKTKAQEGLQEWVKATQDQYMNMVREQFKDVPGKERDLEIIEATLAHYTSEVSSRINMYFEGLACRGVDFSPAFSPMKRPLY